MHRRLCLAVQVRPDEARHGGAGHGRHGKPGRGKARKGIAAQAWHGRCGRLGVVGHGTAGRGAKWKGGAWLAWKLNLKVRNNMRLAFLILSLMALASGGTVSVSFLTLPSGTANGVYVGFAGAKIDGVQQSLLCDDYTTTTSIPSGPFSYNVATLANLATAKFVGASVNQELANYEVAAILLWEFENGGQADPGGYNFALWDIFDPAAGSYGDSAVRLAGARAVVASGGFAQVYDELQIFTAIPSGSNQEFLGLDTPGGVPEPGSFLLVGAGLVGLAIGSKRLRF